MTLAPTWFAAFARGAAALTRSASCTSSRADSPQLNIPECCRAVALHPIGPAERRIRHFENEIVLVNDNDGSHAQSCIRLSDDGKHGYLTTGLEFAWVIDFDRRMFSPHRVYISHRHGHKYVSAYEQPAYRRPQEYATIGGKLIYITFPFCGDEDFARVWTEYLEIRRRQLDETYFKA